MKNLRNNRNHSKQDSHSVGYFFSFLPVFISKKNADFVTVEKLISSDPMKNTLCKSSYMTIIKPPFSLFKKRFFTRCRKNLAKYLGFLYLCYLLLRV